MSSSSPSYEPDHPDGEPTARAGGFRRVEGPEPVPDAEPGAPAETVRRPETLIEVSVRMSNGDTVLVGRFDDVEEAQRNATTLVQGLGRGDGGDWPFIGGRYLRPGAVISVDIVEIEAPKWKGSSERASWAGRQGGDGLSDPPPGLRTTPS